MDQRRILTADCETAVLEDFRMILCACRQEHLDTAEVRQLAHTLNAKWGFADETIAPGRLLDEVQSLLDAWQHPLLASTSSAAAPWVAPAAVDKPLPPLQWDVLRERCQGDIGFCRQLLQMFQQRVADQLAAIEEAVAAGDMAALARKAHAAKSVAATLAADAICRGAAELERLGREGALAAAQTALWHFRQEVKRCREFIPQLLATVARKTDSPASES
jgi:HPt (histidine-containing phosphotransfer) domain-containing protein